MKWEMEKLAKAPTGEEGGRLTLKEKEGQITPRFDEASRNHIILHFIKLYTKM